MSRLSIDALLERLGRIGRIGERSSDRDDVAHGLRELVSEVLYNEELDDTGPLSNVRTVLVDALDGDSVAVDTEEGTLGFTPAQAVALAGQLLHVAAVARRATARRGK